MIKHRQLARQVGAFSEIASESSMDLDNMIFSTRSTFIFGSWICEAGDNGKVQSCLLEDSDHHEDLSISATTTDQIVGRFAQLVMSDPTQTSRLCVPRQANLEDVVDRAAPLDLKYSGSGGEPK